MPGSGAGPQSAAQALKCFLKQLTCFFFLGGVHSPWIYIDGKVGQANGKRLVFIGHF